MEQETVITHDVNAASESDEEEPLITVDQPEEETETPEDASPPGPRRSLPAPIVWSLLILIGLLVIVGGVWGFVQGSWWYGVSRVDAGTTARLILLQQTLTTAGAPEAAVRQVGIAARPGINVSEAIEALVAADATLEPVASNPAIRSVQMELRTIRDTLSRDRYGPLPESAPGPDTLPLPTPEPAGPK